MSSSLSNADPPGGAGSKRRRRSAQSRRRFLQGILTGVPLAAVPVVAGGGFLASLGMRAAQPRDSSASSLTPEETQALKERFLGKAWRNRELGLTESGVAPETLIPRSSLTAVRDAPRGTAARITASHFPIRESILVRMRSDVQRAMAKPIDQRKWIMVIDQQKCVGCSACTVSCKAENQLPPGVVYRPVIEEEIGEYPNVTRRFLPRPCMQCDDPPCTPVCPVGATWKQEDGIVVINYEKCIGCRYCIAACPYGARYFDWGEYYTDDTPERQPYEESHSPEYGRRWRRNGNSSPIGNVRKCQFCLHRLHAGMLPACVTTCIGGATYFGDKNDPDSLVNELLASGRTMRLKEDLGTDPKVYYLL